MTDFERVFYGETPRHTPVVPKIWLDWAALNGYFTPEDALADPELSMLGLVRAARDLRLDACRLFLMPRRENETEGGTLYQTIGGRRVGKIDLKGGWATSFDDPRDFDLSSPAITINPQSYASRVAPIQDASDIGRICVPSASYYEERGYGEMVEKARLEAGDMALIGDCNSGTLSFYVALRGMTDAMLDTLDDPDAVHRAFEKGIEISLQRAAFFLRHGIRILRYNDSSANMKLISPHMWRELIKPHITRFCDEVHKMDKTAKVYCHICGDVRPILTDIMQTGLDCISPLDPMGGADVGEIRALTAPDTVLMGGVDTMLLLNGSPEEVYAVSRACIAQAGGHYILGSGCAVPRGVPKANFEAMVRAAHGE